MILLIILIGLGGGLVSAFFGYLFGIHSREDSEAVFWKSSYLALSSRVIKLTNALEWASKSEDFAPGGKMHSGFIKTILPLLADPPEDVS